MPRFNYAAATSASTEPLVRLRWLTDITMTSTTAKLCTGVTPIAWAATTYSPVGRLGGFNTIEEAGDMYPRALQMWISAVGSANLAEPLTENLFGKSVKVYRAFLKNDLTLVSTPDLRFQGFINKCEVHLADPAKGNFVDIEVESRLRKEPRSARFTKEYLWQTFSGDTFFNFIPQIQGFISKWGTQPTFFNIGGPTLPGGGGHGRGGHGK